MKRRPNKLPEWTRMIWTSAPAKAMWEPRTQRIGALLAELEVLTVEMGFRQAARIAVGPAELVEKTITLAKRGLTLCPLDRTQSAFYSSTGLPYEEGRPWHYMAAVFLAADGVNMPWLFSEGSNEEIGKILGYPACCRKFFQRVWVDEAWLDTTWPMAEQTGIESKQHDHLIFHAGKVNPNMHMLRFSGNERWPANILGRWVNVRAVPWLPCSLACRGTVEAWDLHWMPLAQDVDPEALEWLRMLLQANWRWSALHGIAQIETPIFKVTTRTDTCDELHTVEYVGDGHPLELGVTGTRFPYYRPTEPQLTKGKSFAAGLDALAAVPEVVEHPDDLVVLPLAREGLLWTQNGFSQRQGMEEAHDVLLRTLQQGYTAPWKGYVMDPGCGNGLLLEKLALAYPDLVCCGIECIRERALAAYERLPPTDEECVVFGSLGNLDNWREREYDLVLLMPGRLLELKPLVRDGVLSYLQEHARKLLVYAYSDQQYDSIEDYAQVAGLLDAWELGFQIEAPGTAMAAIFTGVSKTEEKHHANSPTT